MTLMGKDRIRMKEDDKSKLKERATEGEDVSDLLSDTEDALRQLTSEHAEGLYHPAQVTSQRNVRSRKCKRPMIVWWRNYANLQMTIKRLVEWARKACWVVRR